MLIFWNEIHSAVIGSAVKNALQFFMIPGSNGALF